MAPDEVYWGTIVNLRKEYEPGQLTPYKPLQVV